MVGGDTGAVSAAGRDTGVRILGCMRAAVDTHSHPHTAAYDRTLTFCNPGAYSDPHTAAYRYAITSSNTGAHSDSDPNAVGVIYTPASSKPAPTIG